MIEVGANCCVNRGVLEKAGDLGCYSQPRLGWDLEPCKGFCYPPEAECPALGNSLNFQTQCSSFLKAIQTHWNQAGLSSLLFCSILASLSQEGKESLKSQRTPTHRNIKRTGNWFVEWVCRSDWEVILDIEETFQKNEESEWTEYRRGKKGLATTLGHGRTEQDSLSVFLQQNWVSWEPVVFLSGTKWSRCAHCFAFQVYLPKERCQ